PWDYSVCRAVLVTKSVTADNDRLCPTWNKTRNVADDDRLTENCTIKDVTDCSVRRFPHLLKFEFFNTLLIRSDCRTLDTDVVFLDCFCSFDCYFIVSCITVFHS